MHRRYTRKGAFGSYRTGICGAVAGVMLGRGLHREERGIQARAMIPADIYIQEQAKVGMEVEVVEKVIL